MKCAICKKEVEIVYLDKVAGTYVKNADGKRFLVCNSCQTTHNNDKSKMLKALE